MNVSSMLSSSVITEDAHTLISQLIHNFRNMVSVSAYCCPWQVTQTIWKFTMRTSKKPIMPMCQPASSFCRQYLRTFARRYADHYLGSNMVIHKRFVGPTHPINPIKDTGYINHICMIPVNSYAGPKSHRWGQGCRDETEACDTKGEEAASFWVRCG